MSIPKEISHILLNFKIDKKYWLYDNLTGADHDTKRSKPAPFIKKTIEIAKLLNLKTVVEIGSTRLSVSQKCIDYFFSEPIDAYLSPPCCCDGHSTFFWTYENFDVHTVDIDINCINSINNSYNNINYNKPNNLYLHIPQDGISFLKNFTSNIDILYLDGWDKGTYNFAENHMEAYLAAKSKLSKTHLVLIDDTDFNTKDGGKDKLLSPFLIENDYSLLFSGRQTLFLYN